MTEYKHILLATDLSNQTEKIAKKAQTISNNNNAKISAIYVMEHSPVAYGGEYSIPIDASLEESLEKKAQETLNKLGGKFGIAEKDLHIGNGSVKIAVTDLAIEIGADLIVIGTHSHHGLDAILGSRASAILNHAKCDVLVVQAGE